MNYAIDVLIIIFLFTLYGALHSVLASDKVKELFKKKFGELIAFYRLAYNVIAIILLYLLWEISPKPLTIIYDLPNPFDLFTLIPQLIALAGLVWTIKYICFREFIGLSQVKRYLKKNYTSELDEELTLRIEGPYRYSRHPVYFFSIMFLLFRPAMDLFYLTVFLCIVIYFYIGSFYEEKKLIKNFGKIYSTYKEFVPRIFPVKFFHPYSPSEIVETE